MHTIGCFADLWQHLTLSILANFKKMETSKRRQISTTNACAISASEAFAKKFTFFRSFREYFLHADKLLPSRF